MQKKISPMAFTLPMWIAHDCWTTGISSATLITTLAFPMMFCAPCGTRFAVLETHSRPLRLRDSSLSLTNLHPRTSSGVPSGTARENPRLACRESHTTSCPCGLTKSSFKSTIFYVLSGHINPHLHFGNGDGWSLFRKSLTTKLLRIYALSL